MNWKSYDFNDKWYLLLCIWEVFQSYRKNKRNIQNMLWYPSEICMVYETEICVIISLIYIYSDIHKEYSYDYIHNILWYP